MMRSESMDRDLAAAGDVVPGLSALRRRILLLILAGALGAAGGYLAWRLRSCERLPWASARGWRAHAIVPASIGAGGFGWLWETRCAELPLGLRFEERRDLETCLRVAEQFRQEAGRPGYFQAQQARRELEAILIRHPYCFYAEFLLGLWHRQQGNVETARHFFERSFAHAPVVLVQPFLCDDGQPAAGAEISRYVLKCIPVTHGRMQPGLELVYPALITDEAGCVHVPAFGAVCRSMEVRAPRGYEVDGPALGWFRSPAKVGLLPPAEFRPIAQG